MKVRQAPTEGAGLAGPVVAEEDGDAAEEVATVAVGDAAADPATAGDGVTVGAAESDGAIAAAVETPAGAGFAEPVFPATAMPAVTAATATAMAAATHGQRRRAPMLVDGPSPEESSPGRS